MILFACEVAAAIWGFMNRDTVSISLHSVLHLNETCRLLLIFPESSHPTPDRPQISKELINFYDSAYIKAVDLSGSPSKDAAIKVLEVFHRTVRGETHVGTNPEVAEEAKGLCVAHVLLSISTLAGLLR